MFIEDGALGLSPLEYEGVDGVASSCALSGFGPSPSHKSRIELTRPKAPASCGFTELRCVPPCDCEPQPEPCDFSQVQRSQVPWLFRGNFYIWRFPGMGVTPKSYIFMGFSTINQPFWGSPIYGNPPTVICQVVTPFDVCSLSGTYEMAKI